MQDKQVYEYSVVRVVPKVEREEFVNVGVLLYCKRHKFLQMKYQIDQERLRAFSPDLDLDELAQYLHAWDLICQGDPQGGHIAMLTPPERFRWLSATKSTILQSSKVHPGICDAPEMTIGKLFEEYVL
ncbi:DUF3037 domain-containing protein [Pontibacter sp. G13]|uniref:DUF3037 domain-containing protein n=1 Tax=Pontibacter sp. G13 TaxID=3074898 RepID=UPI0028896D81|nr:DUF3037 domain-containing protein [Pontibacter sp. G13]WNJ20272.1 DUF3037 domain-containing protein [Pontibacter sp. G13]